MSDRPLRLVETNALDAFFHRLDHVGQEELMRMQAVWRSIDRRTHEKAWAEIRKAGIRGGLSDEIEEVRERALGWTTYDAVPYRYLDANPTWIQAKADAAEAIVDAAIAVALGDRLDADARETLLAPWSGVAPSS
jgi:hypothetical protein